MIYAAAFLLQSFYTGVERVLIRLLKLVEVPLPQGADWHVKLLVSAMQERAGLHPAIISEETHRRLDEYRSFRHAARNFYGFELVPEKVDRLVRGLEDTAAQFREEVVAFLTFIESA